MTDDDFGQIMHATTDEIITQLHVTWSILQLQLQLVITIRHALPARSDFIIYPIYLINCCKTLDVIDLEKEVYTRTYSTIAIRKSPKNLTYTSIAVIFHVHQSSPCSGLLGSASSSSTTANFDFDLMNFPYL